MESARAVLEVMLRTSVSRKPLFQHLVIGVRVVQEAEALQVDRGAQLAGQQAGIRAPARQQRAKSRIGIGIEQRNGRIDRHGPNEVVVAMTPRPQVNAKIEHGLAQVNGAAK